MYIFIFCIFAFYLVSKSCQGDPAFIPDLLDQLAFPTFESFYQLTPALMLSRLGGASLSTET